MLKKGTQFVLTAAILCYIFWTEINDALWTEHFRCQNIFDGAFVIQLDQSIHELPAFLGFFYYTAIFR